MADVKVPTEMQCGHCGDRIPLDDGGWFAEDGHDIGNGVTLWGEVLVQDVKCGRCGASAFAMLGPQAIVEAIQRAEAKRSTAGATYSSHPLKLSP